MYKTILFVLLSISLSAQQKKVVTSSASMIWDMVNEIAGDKVESRLIVPIGGDPHIHEPTPSDVLKIKSSDLILINGLTFEGWITEVIENSGTTGKTVVVTDGVNAITSEEYKDSYDPHAWMDLTQGQTYIKNIKNALVELDPDNAEYYQKRYADYSVKLTELDSYITSRMLEIPKEKRVLITSHDAFKYYGRRYGIKLESIIGISTEAEAETSDIVRITETIRNAKVPAVFIESTINPKLIKQIAKDANVKIGGSLYADSLGEKGSTADTYYKMMKHNTDVIADALTEARQDVTTGSSESASSHSHDHSVDEGKSSIWIYAALGLLMILGLVLLINKFNK